MARRQRRLIHSSIEWRKPILMVNLMTPSVRIFPGVVAAGIDTLPASLTVAVLPNIMPLFDSDLVGRACRRRCFQLQACEIEGVDGNKVINIRLIVVVIGT